MRMGGQQKILKPVMKLRGGSVLSVGQLVGGVGMPVSGPPALEP